MRRHLERVGGGFAALLLAALLPMCALTGSLHAEAPGPVWMADYAAAHAKAKELGKPLIVHFYGSWCEPCKKMDRETLYTPEVTRAIEDGFVAVKVNITKHPELQKQFKIEALPSDIVVTPSGKVIYHTQGYQSKGTYVSFVKTSSDRFEKTGEKAAKVAAKTVPFSNAGSDKLPPAPVDLPLADELPARPETKVARADTPPAADKPADDSRVGMDGYCPVTLFNQRSWKLGSPDFIAEFQNQQFYFLSAAERDEFQKNPKKYAPRVRGCDPVTLSESNLYVPGTAKFGAFFDGELFLFEKAENRKKFKEDPSRFSKIQHVMNAEEEGKRRI